MANVFGVTVSNVQTFLLPHWAPFSANSSPTSTTVTSIIAEEAGTLEALLYEENITASAITDNTSAAYLWCTKTLRLMAAIQVLRASTMQEPQLAATWAAELKARLEHLADSGATALGDDSLGGSGPDADGPTSTQAVYSLTQDSAEDMSTMVPRLRRDDAL